MSESVFSVREITCVNCPMGCTLSVQLSDGQILSVTGQQCPRGDPYALSEVTDPRRMLTTLIVVPGRSRPLSVRTRVPIPLHLIDQALAQIHRCVVRPPVRAGETVLADVCGTGVEVIATTDLG